MSNSSPLPANEDRILALRLHELREEAARLRARSALTVHEAERIRANGLRLLRQWRRSE